MANFQNNAITESGILLRSHVDMGAVFTATKIVMGSGFIPAGKTAKTMTAVVTPVKELTINKKQRSPDGKVIFGGVYTNENVSATFYFRELALYAKAVYPNGTEIAEVLYCYGNAGNDAELMAAYSTNTAVERQMDIVTFVGNEAEVDLTVESGIFMTRKQVEEMLAELGAKAHADTHAIGGADPITPEMIGAMRTATEIPDGINLNDYREPGEYYKVAGATDLLNYPSMYGAFSMKVERTGSYGVGVTQTIKDHKGNIFVRSFAAETDSDWTEWDSILTSNGDSTIEGSLSVGGVVTVRGGRGYVSANDTQAVLAHRADPDSPSTYIAVRRTDDITKALYLMVENGDSTANSYAIYHSGNAPAVTAAAELV